MESCYKCGVPETRAILFDIILPHGIDKVCGKCSVNENRPVFRDSSDLKVKERNPPNIERLEKISGVKLNEVKKKQPTTFKADEELRNIVKSNFSKTFSQIPEMEKELVDNFHWIVMRARRMKHFSQEQLAKAINEPVEVIKMIESGNAPQKRGVVNKLESMLGIRIRKDDAPSVINEKKEFDFKDIGDFTVYDLKRMQDEDNR